MCALCRTPGNCCFSRNGRWLWMFWKDFCPAVRNIWRSTANGVCGAGEAQLSKEQLKTFFHPSFDKDISPQKGRRRPGVRRPPSFFSFFFFFFFFSFFFF